MGTYNKELKRLKSILNAQIHQLESSGAQDIQAVETISRTIQNLTKAITNLESMSDLLVSEDDSDRPQVLVMLPEN